MPDKIYKCKYCPDGQSPQFTKLHEVGSHQRAMHPVEYAKNKAKKKKLRLEKAASQNVVVNQPGDSTEESTPETEVLTNCIEWFEAGKLEWNAAHRVLRYLEARFAPQSVVECIVGKDGALLGVHGLATADGVKLDAIANEPAASGATA